MTTSSDDIERLRISERLYRLTIENISDAVFLSDDRGLFKYVCPNCHVIFGYDAAEIEPRGLQGLLGTNVIEPERLDREREIRNLDVTVRRKDETERSLLVSVKRVDILGATVLTVCRDVTERRALERQLRQAQKLEAVGLLASGVVHDLNNLLTVVTTFGQSTMDQLENPEAIEDMKEVMKAVDLGGDLLGKLLTFLQKANVVARLVDVNDVIHGVRGLLAGAVRPAALELRLGDDPCFVQMDPVSLQQVLLNVAINARDAMPTGGKFTVTTRNERVETQRLVACGETLPHGHYVVVVLEDTGTGMGEATLERIFDPFFSTKEGQRSGLGLSTCFGIVRQAGGYLRVRSSPGAGSSFEIYLPVSPSSSRVAARP